MRRTPVQETGSRASGRLDSPGPDICLPRGLSAVAAPVALTGWSQLPAALLLLSSSAAHCRDTREGESPLNRLLLGLAVLALPACGASPTTADLQWSCTATLTLGSRTAGGTGTGGSQEQAESDALAQACAQLDSQVDLSADELATCRAGEPFVLLAEVQPGVFRGEVVNLSLSCRGRS